MSEKQSKPWYASKTIWGGLVALLAGLAGVFGYGVSAEAQTTLTESLVGIGASIGGLIAVYGRVTAKSAINKPGDG